MPLTKKGRKVLAGMRGFYGKKKGTQVFYASKNAGRITGVERRNPKRRKRNPAFKRHHLLRLGLHL